MRLKFIIFFLLLIAAFLYLGSQVAPSYYYAFIIILPLFILGIFDMLQNKHAIRKNFPLMGRLRYVMEDLRPKIYQYFIESETDGAPINRMNRSIAYARAKNETETVPFGTQLNVYQEGYEWMHHSVSPKDMSHLDAHPTVRVGSSACTQPYDLSIYNISAMSFGSLSNNAVLALNKGAKLGGFAHNTGEGGIAPYHLEHQGDLIYQFGTGYFGCRSKDGGFDPDLFKVKAALPSVKMIEVKLSQGAKPGHGGILPAKKNTEEIAKIRHVEPGVDVLSPPYHKAFSTPMGLLKFIQELRALSDGKPIGFKLCIGSHYEFLAICKAMQQSKIVPDFITIDGGEGGTGAAPLEFSNSVGMPMREGLAFAYNALRGFNLQEEIKLIAAGKILTGFDIFRALSLGASACYSARGMMLALGCIQALECNKNTCPTGVATQKAGLIKGLDVVDKSERVAEFHKETVHAFMELMAAAGVAQTVDLDRSMVYRRLNMHESKPYHFIYPYISIGALLDEDQSPDTWRVAMEMANEHSFEPKFVLKQ